MWRHWIRICIILYIVGCTLNGEAQRTSEVPTDSVTRAISLQYAQTNFLTQIFLGRNYRKVWATPVTFPVFHLQQTKGGFTIDKLGGGMQTKSLRLKDKSGRDWVLRTVDKDVKKALPPQLRNRFVVGLVQNMVSAAHPYAPVVVSALADATGIIATHPVLYYVPDDPALGEYRSIFAGTICLLERREPTPDNSDTKSTENVIDKIVSENDHLIIQREVLRARLLDMYIADWDRHADQWRWGEIKVGGEKLYYVIPRDRDQAFFRSNGLLVKLATLIGLPHLVGFRKSMHLKKLNNKSWQFDRTFLNELNQKDWQQAVTTFQERLPDSVIEAAVRQLPPPIYAIDGKKLTGILKARRNRLYKNVMKYYTFISTQVAVVGTKEQETFTISNEGDSLTIKVNGIVDGKNDVLYLRKFDPAITKKITLMGLGGDDRFIMDEGVSSRIKLYIQGGDGADIYDIRGGVRTRITDQLADHNQLLHTSKARVHIR